MPITLFKSGDSVKVVRIGGTAEVKKHLSDLGFVPGAEIEIIQSNSGNMIVKLLDSKLALTRDMAEKIFVQ